MSDAAYVYALVVDGTLRYIGKGSGIPLKRAKEHMRHARQLLRRRAAGEKIRGTLLQNNLAKARQRGADIRVVIIASGLSHEAAFGREVIEISRVPEGHLWNLDRGGLGAHRVTAETRAKQSAIGKKRASTPEGRQRLKEISQLAFTPEFRERSRQALLERSKDPAYIEGLRQQQIERWADPERAERMNGGLRKGRRSPSATRSISRWADPLAGERQSEAMKKRWSDPAFRDRQVGKMRERAGTAEGKAAIAKALRARWAEPRL